jgi:eukaryotic-like serine/threonine-protein kinase
MKKNNKFQLRLKIDFIKVFSSASGRSFLWKVLIALITLVIVSCSAASQDINKTPWPSLIPTFHQERVTETGRISPLDEMPQVYVPEGNFLMGSIPGDPGSQEDEFPQHLVYLDAFWIDQFEVTNRMYGECVSSGICESPSEMGSLTHIMYFGNLSFAEHPVVNVSWSQARTYCQWVGRRLPAEAEWEKASRGTEGWMYPWGNQEPACEMLSFGKPSLELPTCVRDAMRVGKYPGGASPYRALDMAGNVWEWVADWYEPDYYMFAPSNNPSGPASGVTKVVRGGAFSDEPEAVRSANRHQTHPEADSYLIGFRCAASVMP